MTIIWKNVLQRVLAEDNMDKATILWVPCGPTHSHSLVDHKRSQPITGLPVPSIVTAKEGLASRYSVKKARHHPYKSNQTQKQLQCCTLSAHRYALLQLIHTHHVLQLSLLLLTLGGERLPCCSL